MAEHWCKEHQTNWFKKGAMKGFAHPILDANGEPTGKWCNEPKSEPKEKEKPFTYSPEKSASIERQVAVKIAFDSCAENEPMAETLARAESIYQWIHNGVKPTTHAVKETEKAIGVATPKSSPSKGEGEPNNKPTKPSPESEALEPKLEPITTEQKLRLQELQKRLLGRMKELTEEWGWNIKAISKLTKDQADHLIEVMDKEAKN